MGGNEVLAGIEKEKLIVIFRGFLRKMPQMWPEPWLMGSSLSKLPTITARMILRHIF